MSMTLTARHARIKELPDIELVGTPDACAIAFRSAKMDIFKVADAMRNRGWNNIACMQKPACLHIPVAMRASFNRCVRCPRGCGCMVFSAHRERM
jgi:glutamate/tyrosine decarboxylase-like PLP-dependent enzyme